MTDAQKQFWLHTGSTMLSFMGPALVGVLQGFGNPWALAAAAALSTLLSSLAGAKFSGPAVPATELSAQPAPKFLDK